MVQVMFHCLPCLPSQKCYELKFKFLKTLPALKYLYKYLINALIKYLYEKVMLHGLIALKFWEESYLGPVLDSCWFVLTRVGLVLTRVRLVLIRVDSCWFVLAHVHLCWYSCIRIVFLSKFIFIYLFITITICNHQQSTFYNWKLHRTTLSFVNSILRVNFADNCL